MVSYMPAFYGKHKFWRFVLPDDLSLKVIFDNVRNYGIAAGVIFSGRYYNQVDGASSWPVWILVGAGIVLVLLNSLQSWYCFSMCSIISLASVTRRWHHGAGGQDGASRSSPCCYWDYCSFSRLESGSLSRSFCGRCSNDYNTTGYWPVRRFSVRQSPIWPAANGNYGRL